jgi:hypothetical protein
MFYTRQQFEDCLRVLKAYEIVKTKDQVMIILANDMAKEMFPEFSRMRAEEQADVLNMIIEDMDIDLYELN